MGRLINTILKELKEHVGWINSIFNNVPLQQVKYFSLVLNYFHLLSGP